MFFDKHSFTNFFRPIACWQIFLIKFFFNQSLFHKLCLTKLFSWPTFLNIFWGLSFVGAKFLNTNIFLVKIFFSSKGFWPKFILINFWTKLSFLVQPWINQSSGLTFSAWASPCSILACISSHGGKDLNFSDVCTCVKGFARAICASRWRANCISCIYW